jgi:hypothetical protein
MTTTIRGSRTVRAPGGTVSRVLGIALCALAALALVPPRPAGAFHDASVHVDGNAWFPSISAEVRASKGALTGTDVTDGDIGLENPDWAPGGSAILRFGPHTLRLEGFGLDAKGDAPLARTVLFDGVLYPGGVRVVSDIDVLYLAADYGFDLVHTPPFAIALTGGVRFASVDARLQAPSLGLDQKVSFDGAMPAIGLWVTAHPFPVPFLSTLAVYGRASGFTIGDAGTFYDLEAGVEWLPIPVLAVRGGYRYVHARGEDSGDRAKVTLSGPFVGVSLAF